MQNPRNTFPKKVTSSATRKKVIKILNSSCKKNFKAKYSTYYTINQLISMGRELNHISLANPLFEITKKMT